MVSSIGAGSAAGNFYLRVKTETERDIRAIGYECVEILRPGLLVGERKEKRSGEAIGIAAVNLISSLMVGPLRQYRPIAADDVAQSMIAVILEGNPGVHIRTFEEMQKRLG